MRQEKMRGSEFARPRLCLYQQTWTKRPLIEMYWLVAPNNVFGVRGVAMRTRWPCGRVFAGTAWQPYASWKLPSPGKLFEGWVGNGHVRWADLSSALKAIQPARAPSRWRSAPPEWQVVPLVGHLQPANGRLRQRSGAGCHSDGDTGHFRRSLGSQQALLALLAAHGASEMAAPAVLAPLTHARASSAPHEGARELSEPGTPS